nr:hypothetical protein [Tanacetum cinerariifolium]
MGVSHDLRGDSWGCVPRSLFWREDLDRDGERGFDYLTFALVYLKASREGCRHPHMDLFSLISAPNLTKVKTETRPRAAYEGAAPVGNPPYTRVAPEPDLRYPTSVHVFPDPILFLAGLKPSWEHGQQWHTIMVGGKEAIPRYGIGSPSALVNTEPPKDFKEPKVQPVEVTADSGESPKAGVFVVHPGSVVVHIKERKCKTWRGSSRPPIKRKLTFGSSSSHVVRAKTYASKDDSPFLSIFDDDEGLQVKYEAAMVEFDQNLDVLALWEKISTLTADVKENKGNLDRMMLESPKYTGYQVTLSTLELKVNSLEIDKARLEAVEASLRRKVAAMKEPFDLSKAKGYYSSYQKDHTQASNDFATATFPWLDECVADDTALIETQLSKNPPMLQKSAPSRTQMHVPSSQKATPSSASSSNPMSPHADLVKPSPSSLE